MLSKKITENDVRAMFAAFGTIEECTVLRDVNTVSRGTIVFQLKKKKKKKKRRPPLK